MTHNDQPRISIIIVSYNSQNEIPDCITSILQQSMPCEIFIVDNASIDGTTDFLREWVQQFPFVHLICNKVNRGLAAANNQPMHLCRGEYILILNPDTYMEPNSLSTMLAYLDTHEDVAAVGPKSRFQNGHFHTSYHYNWTFFHILLWRIVPYRLVRALYDRYARYPECEVMFVSGACLLIRRSVFLEIGGYDERFFLSVEDAADLCMRSKALGYRTVYLPRAIITHIAGRSQQGIQLFATHMGYQGSIYFLEKHQGTAVATLLKTLLILAALTKALFTAILTPVFPQRYTGQAQIYLALARSTFVGYLPANVPDARS